MAKVLRVAGIALVEQPLPIGQEAELDGLDAPIPLAAPVMMAIFASSAGMFRLMVKKGSGMP